MNPALISAANRILSVFTFFVWILLFPVSLTLLVATQLAARLLRETPTPAPHNPQLPPSTRPPCSIIIPTWNGRDLLEKYLPSVIAACSFNIGDEVLVVDNASEDDTATLIRERFPQVRLLPLPKNLGFGGGSNAGLLQARNPFVVMLNSDMRVEPDFLEPLLAPFSDPRVFAVSAQILFSDPNKRREESGLTYANVCNGQLHLGHDVTWNPNHPAPCFYPGGGSAAFHRNKLLQLGGFDPLYHPFYLEDTDLGFQAWKRGWLVLYEPRSVVYHEHRGTIGKRFSPSYIQDIIRKNRILFGWKHFDSPGLLLTTQVRLGLDLLLTGLLGPADHRTTPASFWRAVRQLPAALRMRFAVASTAQFNAAQALPLHQPDQFHDRFRHRYNPQRPLRVLFVSPYPLVPANHGGAVLMVQTLKHLGQHCEVHLLVLLEDESEATAHQNHGLPVASLRMLVRPPHSQGGRLGFRPKAEREFALPQLAETIRKLILQHSIDVVQFEYTQMAQYAGNYRRVLTALFEHDIYFQTVGRLIAAQWRSPNLKAVLEYLRALWFELRYVPRCDYIQVCTTDNANYLTQFLPQVAGRTDAELRAGIDLARYPFGAANRSSETLLFVGNFRHLPNRNGVDWLIRDVMPKVVAARPTVRLRVIGANSHLIAAPSPMPEWLDILGSVDSVQPHLHECGIFLCPVLSGSGVRVKLLEAFACGVPVVSTSIGAEGLTHAQEPVCLLADDGESFAAAILQLQEQPQLGRLLAQRARSLVERDWDAAANTRRLVARYREFLASKAAPHEEHDAAPTLNTESLTDLSR